MKKYLFCLLFMVGSYPVSAQKMELVRMLVATPYTNHALYQSVTDVVAGTIAREFLRAGGIELLDREESERIMQENGGEGWVQDREQASFIGEAMDADIVVYSSVLRNNNVFKYNIVFYQVNNNVIQRSLSGTFMITESPSEIGRIMVKEVAKLQRFVPLPSELTDPGINLRVTMVDPDKLPSSHEIELPDGTGFGIVEQVFSHFRVYPGLEEYLMFANGTRVMRFEFSEELDEDLRQRYNLYNAYGDFAIRHDMQAYFIENCSIRVLNLLIANNIPVFYADDVLIGYSNLVADGFCIFHTLFNNYFDSADISHRDRLVVMFMVPQPGKFGGVPRDYLETAIARFKDEWDATPKLDEITEGVLDLSSGAP